MPRDVTERPILFTGPMVRAIIEGRKTRTRRIAKWPKKGRWPKRGPDSERLDNAGDCETVVASDLDGKIFYVKCPYGGEGDRLWVRETFVRDQAHGKCHYRADRDLGAGVTWTPSIHMPRAACRLRLDVIEYPDLERIWDINDDEAIAEGIVRRGALWGLPEWEIAPVGGECCPTPRDAFLQLFARINGAEVTSKNPWVWVTKFRIAGPGATNAV